MRGVNFGGRRIIKPGGYSIVDTSKMVAVSVGGFKILAFIGESTKGQPKTLLPFNDPTEAKKVLGGGNLLKAMQIAWSPSSEADMNGADLIYAIKVNPATRASHVLQDVTPAAAITLTAKEYGVIPLQVRAVAGTGNMRTVSITDGEITETLPELDTNQAIVDYINANSQIATAVKGTDSIIAAVANYVNFTTAGTNPDPVAGDWEDAIDLLGTAKVHGLLTVTDDETVHAYLKAAIATACTNRRERRGFYGHALSESVEDILTRIVALGTSKALTATPGIKSSVSGTLETLSSVYTAAAIAGLWAGNDSAEPLTFNYINCLGLEKVYTDLEMEQLLEGGATPVEETDAGYRIVLAQTTHLADDNIAKIELSCDTLADEMSIELREYLEKKFVGKKPSPSQSTSVLNAAISKLNQFVRDGKLVANEETGAPAYRNVRVVKEGLARYVEWEGSISTPDNYILITSHFTT